MRLVRASGVPAPTGHPLQPIRDVLPRPAHSPRRGPARPCLAQALFALLVLIHPTSARPDDAPALPSVPRFAIRASPIGLRGDVRPRQYLGVVSPRAAWLGSETGEAELWVHPLKLASGFRLDFRIDEYDEPVRGGDVARTVEVRPEATTITYSHAAFTVREHVLAPLDEPGLLVLLEVDATKPIEVLARFRTVMQYAWPGGMGGQYAFWSADDKAFVLSESLRKRNAMIGSPWAKTATSHPAHALPDAPSTFAIPVDPARAARELIPIAIAGGTAPREETRAAYRRLIARAREIYDARVAHARALREDRLRVDSPDDRLDLAFEWAKVNLDEQTVCNPDLGCGLVAGWGPSGEGARPGFGWFFGGDAAINSLAMAGTGQWSAVRDGLRFLAKYQRADGKIPHEVSQSAGVVPWFDEFPYAYYHADTTPFFLLALERYWRASGDGDTLGELWPRARKAWEFCLPHDADGDGIMENTTAGLGAIEVGAIGDEIHQDVYLAAVFTQAAQAMERMAAARGEPSLAAQAREVAAKARASIESRYWIPSAGHHAFGVLRSGGTNDTLTVWPATAAAFGLLEPRHARLTLAALGSHALTADWGARMLTTASPLYDHAHYNMGAVWPFVTGFLALGHYRYERPWAGYPLIDALSGLAFDWARGRHPELLSGDRYRPLDTAVPQQFFASSMLVTPLVAGLLGFEADAPARRARLAPQLPAHWPGLAVAGLPVGESRLDVAFERLQGGLRMRLGVRGGPLRLDVQPLLPPGARNLRARLDGSPVAARPAPSVPLAGEPRVLELRWEGGFELAPPTVALEPGQADAGVRILDAVEEGRVVRLEVEGLAGSTATLRLWSDRPPRVEGAALRARPAASAPGTAGGAGGQSFELEVALPPSATRFSRAVVRVARP